MTDRERLLGMLEMVTGLDSLESILQRTSVSVNTLSKYPTFLMDSP